MNVYNVYCKEKKGYWIVLADTEKDAIYEITKGYDNYTEVYATRESN